ncbi:MAG: LysM peptidoglycan-binding domain-containing protein [Deltaproteobacteria bacterium]|nr:MAG: LysM peptidoglycan-binding domain-containing protein [Deltaproteobacteria bacterium]
MKLYPIFFLIFLISACSSVTPIKTDNYLEDLDLVEAEQIKIEEPKSLPSKPQTIVEVIQDYEVQSVSHVQSSEHGRVETQKIVREAVRDEDPTVDPKSDLHLTYIPKYYKFWMKYFTKRDKERFLRHMQNGEKYRELIKQVFRSHGLPEDLYYVGLIESGYNTKIRSHAGAVGPWQFIKGTATRYGMKVNNHLDERRNIHKATEAAAAYFKDLYNIFGSWELALCAYNAGEYRIIGAIRKGNSRDYIDLVKKKLLPKETIYYVPKVVAARELGESAKRYGFNVKKNDGEFYTSADLFKMTKSFDLRDVSKKLGVSYKTLQTLNPDVKYRSVRATRKRPVHIVIPESKMETMASIYPELKTQIITRTTVSKKPVFYKVRKGDNLIKIASKFNTSVRELKVLNPKLKRRDLWANEKIRIPGVQTRIYIVKRGDNLSKIARKFGTSIGKILAINSLKSKRIFPEQKLRVPSEG